jgi:hypothetical protein
MLNSLTASVLMQASPARARSPEGGRRDRGKPAHGRHRRPEIAALVVRGEVGRVKRRRSTDAVDDALEAREVVYLQYDYGV